MKPLISLFFMATTLFGCVIPPLPTYEVPTSDMVGLTREQAIAELFADQPNLEPLEGIWVWDNDQYEAALKFEPNYNNQGPAYVGIVTRASLTNWNNGDIKIVMRPTSVSGVYVGKYYMGDGSEVGISYFTKDPNLIEFSIPSGYYGELEKGFLIRTWPVSQSRQSAAAAPDATMNTFGTCFAVTEDGLLLTSNHVVEGSKAIQVTLSDGRKLPAYIVQASGTNDLALIKVSEATQSFLSIANSRTAKVGQQVFTMGYPAKTILGDEPKYTDGSISSLSGLANEASYMQVSIPIQPGNSGGPVVNESGEVVGVVAATAAVEKFFAASGALPQNINWAVKAEYAQPMFEPPVSKLYVANKQSAIDLTRQSICQVEAVY